VFGFAVSGTSSFTLIRQVDTGPKLLTGGAFRPGSGAAHPARAGIGDNIDLLYTRKKGKHMNWIDLRSDTVTTPTPAMREAMYAAEVGDDVYGEDPTINRLQTLAAEKTGKETGLFVPSGTMGNLAAVLAHCGRGMRSYWATWRIPSCSSGWDFGPGGVHSHQSTTNRTAPWRWRISRRHPPDDAHFPVTRLICLENTHNRCGGWPSRRNIPARWAILRGRTACGCTWMGRDCSMLRSRKGSAPRTGWPGRLGYILPEQGAVRAGGIGMCGSGEFIRGAHRIRKQLAAGCARWGCWPRRNRGAGDHGGAAC